MLRPGGRIALAVWDEPGANPWATITSRALIEAGTLEPPAAAVPPGCSRWPQPGVLEAMLDEAGFVDVRVEPIQLDRGYDSFQEYWSRAVDLSQMFSGALEPSSRRAARAAVETGSAARRAVHG